MWLKKTTAFIMVFCLSLTITGCWDSVDINQKTLVTTVIIDYKNGEYYFYLEVPNLLINQGRENQGGQGKEIYSVVTGQGKSYTEARRYANAKLEMPVFLGSVSAIVITDDLVKQGIREYFHRVQSDKDYRKALHVVTTFEEPEKLLTIDLPIVLSIGRTMDEIVQTHEKEYKFNLYSVSEILEYLYSNTCFVLINMDLQD